MQDDVQRFVSPEGDRMAFVDMETGHVWLLKRLSPADAAGTVAMLPRWRPITSAPPSESRPRRDRRGA